MKKFVALLLLVAMLLPLAANAITVVINKRMTMGTLGVTIATITMDSSYPTAGESLTPAMLGLTAIDMLIPIVDKAGVVPQYDYSAETLLMYETGDTLDTHLNVLNDTGVLTDVVVRVIAFGTGQ
jgi:hypothetical protein